MYKPTIENILAKTTNPTEMAYDILALRLSNDFLQKEIEKLKQELAKLKPITCSLDFGKPVYDKQHHNEQVVIHRVGKSSVEYGYKQGGLKYIMSLDEASENWYN